jgi:hypothetical protein
MKRKGRWEVHTVFEMADVDHAWRNTDEKDAVLLVLCVELGYRYIHGRLTDRVQRSHLVFERIDWIQVRQAGGYGDDLLNLALEDEWDEKVKQVDVGYNVDVDRL